MTSYYEDAVGFAEQLKKEVRDQMTDDYLAKLIDDHWAYIEGILRAHALGDPGINLAKYHYKTAFRHGYKHAREDAVLETAKLETLTQGYREAVIAAQDLYP